MKYLALAGGVGGAKLALGMSKVLPPSDLTVVVNTGDDEEFHGLHVSPDVDTVMYTLAGLSNPETGWGITGETFNALERLNAYGADTWFNLGDKDLATHIRRTDLLRQGYSLSEVTESLRTALGVTHPIVPMSDDPVRTMLTTDIGELPMQTWFVQHRCEPAVSRINFAGSEQAKPALEFTRALRDSDALVFCPSNPFVSVAPILAIPGVRDAIQSFDGMRIAVSPIVGGQAVKGPAAKMMGELGIESSCVGVAAQYQDLCDLFILDDIDGDRAGDIEALGMRAAVTNTMMLDDADKVRLAEYICGLTA